MAKTRLRLFQQWPALGRQVAHVDLCDLPTPITPAPELAGKLGLASLSIKRDDLSARDYGGNKIRKLEFLLGAAQQGGYKRVLTFGYAGSNFAAATALNAHKLGMRSIAMLLPQANAAYLRENLLLSVASKAACHQANNEQALVMKTIWVLLLQIMKRQRPYWIPPGGSSPLGLLGFVNAALELRQQIEYGELPMPDAIYLALGSMGTAAGLAIGLRACGLDIPIHAVRVVPERFGNRESLEKLVTLTTTFIRSKDPSFPDTTSAASLCRVRDEFFGEGYGVFSEAGTAAADLTAAHTSIELDGTYSAKAMAALMQDAQSGHLRGRNVLFWNTHNSRDTRALIAGADYRSLPAAFYPYFEATDE